MIAFIIAALLRFATPVAGTCYGPAPYCEPYKHALCVCESDISYKCGWICVGTPEPQP
jgi:hypothetical protein